MPDRTPNKEKTQKAPHASRIGNPTTSARISAVFPSVAKANSLIRGFHEQPKTRISLTAQLLHVYSAQRF